MDKIRKASNYSLKFRARVKMARKIGSEAFYEMPTIDPKKMQRNLPHAKVVLEGMI